MNEDPILKEAYDEVLKNIGRNLLMCQQAELILKELLRLGGCAIRSGAPEESFGEMAKRAQKMTLGGLATLFTETHCSGHDPEFPELPEDAHEAMIAMSFSFKLDQKALAERQESLATLVAERNRLVHHYLPSFDKDSLESCRMAAEDLHRQRESILRPEIKRLQGDLRFVQQGLSEVTAFMTSPEGMEILRVTGRQQHPLIQQLVDLARNHEPAGDWITLKSAGKCITGFSRDQISQICADFGHPSLTALMTASQLFDIEKEPVEDNRHRAIYRLKQDGAPTFSRITA